MKKTYLPCLLFVIALVFIFPRDFYNDLSDKTTLVDNGWKWALHFFSAHFERYHWGKDVIYTYGPLGILSARSFPFSLWFLQFAFDIYIGFNLFVVFRILLKQYSNLMACIYGIGLLVSLWEVNWLLQLSNVLLLILLYKDSARHRVAYIIAINIALLLFIKLNTLWSVAFILPTLVYLLISTRKYSTLLGSLILMLGASMLIGSLTHVSYVSYFQTSLDTVAYYTHSMYYFTTAYRGVFYIGVVFSVVLILLLAYLSIRSLAAKRIAEVLLFANIFILYFILFKQGFTRFDREHFNQYLCLTPLVVFCLYLVTPDIRNIVGGFWAITMLAVLGICGVRFIKGYQGNIPVFTFKPAPLFNYTKQLVFAMGQQQPENLSSGGSYDYYINQCINQKTNSNDNWHNRPAFQSIVTVSRHLDSINTAYYSGADAPDTIFYDGAGVDDRNPFWDDPLCKWTIWSRYQYAGNAADQQLLLTKRQVPLQWKRVLLLDTTVSFGQALNIPAHQEGVVVFNAAVNYSSVGKLQTFLFQPPATTVKIHLNDAIADTLAPFRFIPPLHNNEDLMAGAYALPGDASLFQHLTTDFNHVGANVKSVTFLTDRLSGVDNKIKVKLYLVQAQL
ncbi:hypothetical protein [Taibaiella soli]|uniref:hypothetical protein n=1 Tax=Taibaiella soli TaxID=1649169 RepID=UPI000F4E3606|nr:hypothetical protein [Taibaiella soli]